VPAQAQLGYEAGGWEIDAGRRELRLHGALVPVGFRAFEVLEALVKSAGELVTKDDLMGRVWPGAIVEENTLVVHVHAIRKALGPDPWPSAGVMRGGPGNDRSAPHTRDEPSHALGGHWISRIHSCKGPFVVVALDRNHHQCPPAKPKHNGAER
jgi:Transcriptional regulatory protein, C terminal